MLVELGRSTLSLVENLSVRGINGRGLHDNSGRDVGGEPEVLISFGLILLVEN